MNYNTHNEEKILEEYNGWFKFLLKLPLILVIFTGIEFFVLGIVFADIFDAAIIVFWLVGAATAGLTYVFTKILLSATVLKVYYLKSINEKLPSDKVLTPSISQNKKTVSSTINTNQATLLTWTCKNCGTKNHKSAMYCSKCHLIKGSEKPNNEATWTCPQCGEKNNPASKKCINCFASKP